MPGKIITTASGRKCHVGGRLRPADLHTKKHLRFADLKAAGVLPSVTVPATTNFAAQAIASLSDILGNDTEGDCVEAGVSHARALATCNFLPPGVIYDLAQVNCMYSAVTGYDPSQTQPDGSNPTDQGTDENAMIQYLKTTGFPDGVKVRRAVSVDATDIAEVRQSFFTTLTLIYGMQLDAQWINPMPDGPFVWDLGSPPSPDPRAGHCVPAIDIVDGGMKINSWAMPGVITDPATSFYAAPAQGGQLFSYITDDILAVMASRFNWDPQGLLDYLDFVGAEV